MADEEALIQDDLGDVGQLLQVTEKLHKIVVWMSYPTGIAPEETIEDILEQSRLVRERVRKRLSLADPADLQPPRLSSPLKS